MMLNEPSVGLYRVQEHVRRSLLQLVDKKVCVNYYVTQCVSLLEWCIVGIVIAMNAFLNVTVSVCTIQYSRYIELQFLSLHRLRCKAYKGKCKEYLMILTIHSSMSLC